MAPTTSASSPQPPPPPPVGPAKKKTSPLVWILVGCLGLFVIGGIIFAAATFFVARKVKDVAEDFAENPVRESVEAMVRLNPDLELVSTDDAAETMTIRDKTTGKVATFDWSDLQNGNFSFEAEGEEYNVDASGIEEGRLAVTDGSGEVVALGPGAGGVPSWFPEYPGTTDVNVLVSATQDGQDSTIWTFQSSDQAGKLLAFYQERLQAESWEVTTNSSGEDADQGSLDATRDGATRNINLVATSTPGGATQVMVTYTATGG
jgi:hypothetical protein